MREIKWNVLKDARLKRTRGVSFEEILKSKLIAIGKHPKRKDQEIMYFLYRKYIWMVPFVKADKYIFLKTLYPSRQHTRLYKKWGRIL